MTLFNVLLWIHIATGIFCLVTGLFIVIGKKGTNTHKKAGLLYFWAMLANVSTALPMSWLHPNLFLALIAVWTLYMLLSGRRYLYLQSPEMVVTKDWILSCVAGLAAFIFMAVGLWALYQKNSFGWVVISFATIMLIMVIQDYRNFKGKTTVKNFGLTSHIQRMTGSYIATLTAFLVVNNKILPPVVAWLLPTAIMTPLLVRWVRKWEIKNKGFEKI